MRIAIVGSGISGLTSAYLLAERHEVVLFEKDDRLGGHTHTHKVFHEGREWLVDSGFIVFNRRNYPRFCHLLELLRIEARPTTMSFSVRDDGSGFEYGGSSLGGLLGSPLNVVNPRWWRVVLGAASLGRRGKAILANIDSGTTIGDLCRAGAFSPGLLQDYLLPMAGAIWSAPRTAMLDFPAEMFLRFFDNHGMLDLRERPQWLTVQGGSSRYIAAMMERLSSNVRLRSPVVRLHRSGNGVSVESSAGAESFDAVVLACHADQALAIISDASSDERSVLSALPYQANDAVLHSDAGVLPRRHRCWAAWNYRLDGREADRPVAVTYNMSILQGLDTRMPICVSLNDAGAVDSRRVFARMRYHHPVYTVAGQQARADWARISGVRGVHFCGAYWGNGFHEDGVSSAMRVCELLGAGL